MMRYHSELYAGMMVSLSLQEL